MHIPFDFDAEQRHREMVKFQKASMSWFWRTAAALVAIGTIANAIFQGLNYFS